MARSLVMVGSGLHAAVCSRSVRLYAAACAALSRANSTVSVRGGSSAASTAEPRRCTKRSVSSRSRCMASSACSRSAVLAFGCRPRAMGVAYSREKAAREPSAPGLTKSHIVQNSDRSFCKGVPVSRTRRDGTSRLSASIVWLPAAALIRCPSSHTRSPMGAVSSASTCARTAS